MRHDHQTEFHAPKNCQPVHLRFHGEKVAKVMGQDLRDDTASDLTAQVAIHGDELGLAGSLIRTTGTAARSSSADFSEPGMVLVLVLRL